MMYGYGMGSHLVHQDGDGIGMIWERNSRSYDRREIVQIAHCAREIGDLCTMAFIRAWVTLKLANRDMAPVLKIWKDMNSVAEEMHKIAEQWWNVESKFGKPGSSTVEIQR